MFYNNGKGWITIDKVFTGNIDGNNKKIIGLNQNFDDKDGTNVIGFIYEIFNSNIKNLNFENINIKVNKYIKDNSRPNTYGGGLAEYISKSNLDNVTLDGNITINYENTGSPFILGYVGVFSYHIGNSTINNCINKINIESNLHGMYGGLSGKSSDNEINNFINYGNIKANNINNIVDYYVGGIFGWPDGYVQINNSKNYGEILGKDSAVFVAYANKRLEIKNSVNYGNINVVGSSGGGLVGTGRDLYITESINKGNINVSSGKYQGGYIEGVGSIVGFARGKIQDVVNLGKIIIKSCNIDINIGGIVGYLEGKLINSYNIGKVDLSSFNQNENYYKSDNGSPQISDTFITGAVVGGSSSDSTFDNFYYLKDTMPILIYGRNKVHYIGSQSDKPLTLNQMLDKNNYQEFDFNNKWYINSYNGYMFPQLRNVKLEGNYISKVNILNNDNEININNNYLELNASVLPNNSELSWSIIEGNDIVNLDNNILKFKDTGKVKVRATSKDFDAMYDEKEFNIVNKLITNISFNKSNINLKIGNSEKLIITYTPSDASNKSVIWKSSNTSVATVDSDGVVTAKGVGNVVISASTLDASNKTVKCNITVNDIF